MKKKNSRKSKKRVIYTNRNAFIDSTVTSTGRLRTETAGRDEGTLAAEAFTDPNAGRTSLRIFRDGVTMRLSGREARTIYRVLQRHYGFAGKAVVEQSSAIDYNAGYLY